VVNEAGEDQSWSLHPATSLPAELALAHDGFAEAAWWLAGDETAALPEGRYTLVAELDTERATSGWQGRAVSPPVELALSAEPSPLAPELARAKRHLGLSLLLLRGEREAAETEVESLLREDPDDLSALEIRGDLLAEGGREDEALAAYGRALELFSELSPDSPEPPDTLLAKRHALLTRRLMPE
jgi:tetratricopeptide (TPR) repeat protein